MREQDLYEALGPEQQQTLEQLVAPEPKAELPKEPPAQAVQTPTGDPAVAQIQADLANLKTQDDLNKYFATSGHTADQFAAAAPQYGGLADYLNAMEQGKNAYGVSQIKSDIGGLKTQDDLNKYFATSGYSAEQFAQAAPQYGSAADYVNAMSQGTAAYNSTQPTSQMTREAFIKKYALGPGGTFLADDKGGNAASEVAGMDVGQYYDSYIGPGAVGSMTDDNGNLQNPIWMSTAGKYSNSPQYNDADGWTAYDYVNPHPESNDLGGLGEFWRQVGRPAATMAAMYYGVGALGEMGAGAAGSTAASGPAGWLGMSKGVGATALNSGALSAGRSLATGHNIGDAIASGFKTAATSGMGSFLGDVAMDIPGVSPDMANVLGNTGAQALVNGPNAAKGYLINGMVDLGIGSIAKDIGLDKLPPEARQAATATIGSVLQGKNPTDALINIAAGKALDTVFGGYLQNIPGYSTLSTKGKQAVMATITDGLRGKNVGGDIFNLAIAEATAETKRQKQAEGSATTKTLTDAGLTQDMAYDDTLQTGPSDPDYSHEGNHNPVPNTLDTVYVTGTADPDYSHEGNHNPPPEPAPNTLPTVTVIGKGEPPTFDFPVPDPVEDLPVVIPPAGTTTTKPTTTAPKPATTTAAAPQYTGVDGYTTYGLPTELADILQMDLDEKDILKYLQKAKALRAPKARNPVYAAEGGSIDNLIEYLRR